MNTDDESRTATFSVVQSASVGVRKNAVNLSKSLKLPGCFVFLASNLGVNGQRQLVISLLHCLRVSSIHTQQSSALEHFTVSNAYHHSLMDTPCVIIGSK